MELLSEEDLPDGMVYPGALQRLVSRGVTHLEPWCIFEADQAMVRLKGMMQRYPSRTLLPFARREDNDDVACFDRDEPGKVVVVHDFATNGWEKRVRYADFYAWLRQAVEDMIEFDSYDDS